MARWRWLLSAALAALAISSVATVQAQNGGAVSIDQIPVPAQNAILEHVGMGELMQVVEETGQNGEPVYEGRISRGVNEELDIWVDAAGNVLDVHRPM